MVYRARRAAINTGVKWECRRCAAFMSGKRFCCQECGELRFETVQPRRIRAFASSRVDPRQLSFFGGEP